VFDSGETKSVSTPFGAVVGQGRLKEALLAVAVDDGLDGLLVSGEKGTAKSTLVRGLAELLPAQRAVADCPYGCPPDDRTRQCESCRERAALPVETRPVPLVTLPLGATRDRVVGTLSVSDALAGDAEFDPGLLARANRGLLYVDEINLLEDHLVDVLLDAAASGVNRVERDGVSVAHPAEFTLVGTMNPEEGDLRPQLRDRFGLSVEVQGERDIDDRVAVIDGDLHGASSADDDTDDHRRRLDRARDLLDSVALTDDQKRDIAELCVDAGVDGHRADIATARAARALAALAGRPTATDGDIRRAAELALNHRMQSAPFEDAPDAEEVIDDHFEDGEGEQDAEESADEDAGSESEPGSDVHPDGADDGEDAETELQPSEDSNDQPTPEDGPEADPDADGDTDDSSAPNPQSGSADDGVGAPNDGSGGECPDSESDDGEDATPLVPGQPREEPAERPEAAAAPEIDAPEAEAETGSGRAGVAPAAGNRGTRVRTERTDGTAGIDAAASARTAAKRGSSRIDQRDLRQSVRSGDGEALVVFAVDASASMRPAMRAAKGVTLELLEDAYTERDSVAVVAFAGEDAQVLLPPTDSVTLAARHLKELPTGNRTPLPAGLRTAKEVVDAADPEAAVVVVVSDGRANAEESPTAETRRAAESLAETGARVVCVDAGERRGVLGEVLVATDGERVPLDALTPERVERAVTDARR